METNPRISKHSVDETDQPAVEMTLLDITATELVQPITEREARVQRALALAGQYHGPEDLAQEHDRYVSEAYEA